MLSLLGSGSMGTVYLALDPNIQRRVAVKVLRSFAGMSDNDERELRKRFVREARAAGRLSHPGIVTVHDAERDPETGSSFIAMEWVEGSSLDEELRREGMLAIPRAVDIAVQVAEALDAAHAAGLVHRDVKPANILLTREGRAKVSDFGVVKFASMSTTVPGHVLGSPYYMSPEQVRSAPVDERSDLFSLGVVLYQCLTGAVPFAAESLAGITYKVLEIDPRPARSIRPSIPEDLAAVVERAVAKDPDERFQSGAELARALRRVATKLDEETGGSLRGRVESGVVGGAPEGTRSGVAGPAGPRQLSLTAEPRPEATGERREAPPAVGTLPPTLEGGRRPVWIAAVVLAAGLGVGASWMLAPSGDEGVGEAAVPGAAVPSVPAEPSTARVDDLAPPARAAATLVVGYRNRLKSARMTVLVDERETWSEPVAAPGGLFRRAKGRRVEAVLQVAEGAHVIEVRVDGDGGRIAARGRIEAFFRSGGRRELTAALIPPDFLKLTWES